MGASRFWSVLGALGLCLGGFACGKAEDTSVASDQRALVTPPTFDEYVVYAENSLATGDTTALHGHVGVHDSGAIGAHGTVADGVRASIGAWSNIGGSSAKYLLADTVILRYGTYFWVSYVGTAYLDQHAAGYVVNNSFPTNMPNTPRARPATPGAAVVSVTASSTVTVTATASISRIDVAAGGVLEFPAGLYEVESITLEDGATLRALGAVELLVSDRITGGDRVRIQVASGLTAKDFRLEVFGENGGSGGPLDLPLAFGLGAQADFRALLLAPHGTIQMGASSTGLGAISAEDVHFLGANTTVSFEDGIQALSGTAPRAYADAYVVAEDQVLTETGEGVLYNDLDPAFITLTATLTEDVSHGTLALSSDGSFTYTPSANYSGTDSFVYGASNGTTTTTAAVTIVVDPANDIPNIVSSAYPEAFVGQLWTYQVLVDDPDQGDVHSYTVTGAPTGMSISASTGLVSWMPSQTQTGAASFTVQVTDTSTASDVQPVSMTVVDTPASDGFVIYAEHSLFLDANVVVVDAKAGVQTTGTGGPYVGGSARAVVTYWATMGKFAGADLFADSVILKYASNAQDVYTNSLDEDAGFTRGQVAALPSMPSLPTTQSLSPGTHAISHSGAGVELTITATQAGAVTVGAGARLLLEAGIYEFTSLVIGDGATVAALGPIEIRISGRLDMGADAYIGPAEDADVDTNEIRIDVHAGHAVMGEPLSRPYAVQTSTASSIAATLVAPNGTASFGEYSYNWGFFGARDVIADRASIFFLGEVTPPNRAPVITSRPKQRVDESQPYAYGVAFSDPDANDSWTFSLDAAPATMTVSSDGLISWTPTSQDVGTSTVTVRVTDAAGLYDPQTYLLTVDSLNGPPVFVGFPSTATADEDTPFSVDIDATDPNGDVLTYALVVPYPTGATIDAAIGVITWTPDQAAVDASPHTVTVRVSDGPTYAQQAFTVIVNPGNGPPVVTPIVPQSATEGAPFSLLVVASDPENDPVTFSFGAEQPYGMTIDPVTGLISWTPRNSQVGAQLVDVVASDGQDEGSASFTVTVSNINNPPEIISSPKTSITSEDPYTYQVVANDPDVQDSLTYTLSTTHGSAPDIMTMTPSGTIQWNPRSSDEGTHDVQIVVTDSVGATDTQNYTLEVLPGNPPTAAFRTARGRVVSYGEDGAKVHASSGAVRSIDEFLLYAPPTPYAWQNLPGQTTNNFVIFELVKSEIYVIDQVRLESTGGGTSVKNFTVSVSTTGTQAADFREVLSAQAEMKSGWQSFGFAAAQARYVRVGILDHHAPSGNTLIRRFEVYEQYRNGGLLTLDQGGAVVTSASVNQSTANRGINADTSDHWPVPTNSLPADIRVAFSDSGLHRVDRVVIRPKQLDAVVQRFAVDVSSTTDDPAAYTNVLTATAADHRINVREQWFTFPATSAKYVRLRLLSVWPTNYTETGIAHFGVYSPDIGAHVVAFDNLSTDPDDDIVYHSWDFGDGRKSGEVHPTHVFEPGSYDVSLTVTDAAGQTSSTAMTYQALHPPQADFAHSPRPFYEDQPLTSPDSTWDLSRPGTGPIVDSQWSDDSWMLAARDDGSYPVTLTVSDGYGLTDTTTKQVTVANSSPTADAGGELEGAWGLPVHVWATTGPQAMSTWDDPSPVDHLDLWCRWLWGDGAYENGNCTDIPGTYFHDTTLTIPHAYAAPGDYTIELAVFDEDGAMALDTTTAHIRRRRTAAVVLGADQATAQGVVTVRAQLIDRDVASTAMSGYSVTFQMGAQNVVATTGTDGMATADLQFVGGTTNSVNVVFAGDAYYEASEAANAFNSTTFPAVPTLGPPSAVGSRGSDYIVAFGPNVRGQYSPYYDPTPELYITSAHNDVITVSAPGLGTESFTDAYEVSPGQITVAGPLPTELTAPFGSFSSGVFSRALRVSGHHPFTLTAGNLEDYSSDAFLALPVSELGTDHVVASYASHYRGFILVAAPEDGTEVTITTTDGYSWQNVFNTGPGVVTQTIDSLEVLEIYCVGTDCDFTGSQVTSNKPVAVFSGVVLTEVPTAKLAEDHLVEQFPSTDRWGEEFVVSTFAGRDSGDFVRILPAQNGTVIKIDGTTVATLGRGSFHEIDLSSGSTAYIETSGPSLVVQYAKGDLVDGISFPGDPSMLIVPPVEQYASDYLLQAPFAAYDPVRSRAGEPHLPAGRDFTHQVNVVAPTADVGCIRLDGVAVTGWTPVVGTSLSVARVLDIGPEAHRLQCLDPTVRFHATMYGFGTQDAYAYPGEMDLRVLVGCTATTVTAGDGIDNDCDGTADEELANSLDDDGDGLIDEDLIDPAFTVAAAPSAFDSALAINEDTYVAVVLTAYDSNGDPLTYNITQAPTSGTLYPWDLSQSFTTASSPLTSYSDVGPVVIYQPNTDANGTDTLQFEVSDGTSTSPAATVTIDIHSINDAPYFTSTPPAGGATEGAAYTYTLLADDPDQEAVAFILVDGPTGLTLTGSDLGFTPTNADVGAHEVVARVVDASGLGETQTFSLVVADVNAAPYFTSTDVLDGTRGIEYRYPVTATDEDFGDQIRFSLLTSPVPMQMDAVSGLITWTPTTEASPVSVTMRVTDASQATTERTISIALTADTLAPIVSVTASPQLVDPGEVVTLTVTATDDIGVSSTALTVNGSAVTLDANGQAVYTTGASGQYIAVATADDAAANQGTAQTAFAARDSSDTTPPFAALESPVDRAVVTEPTAIVGSATDANMVRWVLRYSQGSAGALVDLAEGTTSVTSGTLATFDPTLLQNGLYRLELEVTDVNGAVATDDLTLQVEGNMKVGVFSLAFNDLQIPMGGIPITVTRSYDSRVKTQEDFGIGWDLSVSAGKFTHNRDPAEGWSAPPQKPIGWSGLFFFPCRDRPNNGSFEVQGKEHITEVRLSDAEIYRFKPDLLGGGQVGGGCLFDVTYTQDSGLPGATLDIVNNRTVWYQFNTTTIYDDLTFTPFDPQTMVLTTYDGRTYTIDKDTGVQQVEDLREDKLFINETSLVKTSSLGVVLESITFVRDPQGRIEEIQSPDGTLLEYVYDAAGDLVTFVDAAGYRTEFTYDTRHNLQDIFDPLGNRAIRNEYDSAGRLVATIDADGNRMAFNHDLANNRETLTDRTGYSYYFDYDARGNVLTETYPGFGTTTRTYDSDDNTLTETDGLGRTTTWTYNQHYRRLSESKTVSGQLVTRSWTYDPLGNISTQTDPLGNTSTSAYDIRSLLLSRTEPGNGGQGFTSTFKYDRAYNQTQSCNAQGDCRTMQYDGLGRVTQDVDERGHAVDFAYDTAGRMTTTTDSRALPGGGTETLLTTYHYDLRGLQTKTDSPDGSSSEVLYDARGLMTARIDQLGRTTTYEYDTQGHRTLVRNPDQTTEGSSYDVEGRITGRTDRMGRVRNTGYDARGRMSTMTFDGASSGYSYDLAGQLTSTTDRRGFVTTQVYDEAGRVTEMRAPQHASGTATSRSYYDVAGRLTGSRDAQDRLTSYGYDVRGQMTLTTYADASTEQSYYNALGRLTSKVDRGGTETQHGYDVVGNLTSVTNVQAGETWVYAYDDQNNLTTITDPQGHSRTFAFDKQGRETSRQFHIGPAQTRGYDTRGNLTSRSMYDSALGTTTFGYDVQNRLTQRNQADGQAVSMNYWPNGQRASATDIRGGQTLYYYDAQDRLTYYEQPSGRSLAYGYDAAGNLTSRTADTIGSIWTDGYSYDEAGRVTTVTTEDPFALTTENYGLGYDTTGQLTSLAYPNGLTTSYGYDVLGQLTRIEIADPTQIVERWDYSRLADGNIGVATDFDGSTHTYGYDAADRLTSEVVADGQGAAVHTRTYEYDTAGNRTRVTYTPAVGTGFDRTATYDARDRLQTDGTVTFTWDDDGRMLSRSGAEGYVLSWDSEDRLLSVTYADGAVAYHDYNAYGVLMETLVVDATGTSSTTRHLVDTQRSLSHIVADVDGSGVLLAGYSRTGDMLLGRSRVSGGQYYHGDQIGSVRHLSNASGGFVAGYEYSPYGVLASESGETAAGYLFAGERGGPKLSLRQHRRRWATAKAAFFLSEDKYEAPTTTPLWMNKYVYAQSSPISRVDPTGLFPMTQFVPIHLSLSTGAVKPGPIVNTTQAKLFTFDAYVGEPVSASLRPQRGEAGFRIRGVRIFVGRNRLPQQTVRRISGQFVNAVFDMDFFYHPDFDTWRQIASSDQFRVARRGGRYRAGGGGFFGYPSAENKPWLLQLAACYEIVTSQTLPKLVVPANLKKILRDQKACTSL